MDTTEIVSLSINVIVMLLGLSGNAIIIAVYSRKKAKKSTDTLILSQAILDFTGGIVAPIDIIRTLANAVKSDALCKFTIYSSRIVAYSALYLTSAIAVDRCVLIKRPFDRRTSPKKAFIGVVFSVMFAGVSQSYNFVYVDLADFGICVRHGMPAAVEIAVSILTTASFATTLLLAVVCYGVIYASIRSQARVRAAMVAVPQSTVGNTGTVCETYSTDCGSNVAPQPTDNGRQNIFIVGVRPKESLEVPFDDKHENGISKESNEDAHPQGRGNNEACTTSGDQSGIFHAIPHRSPEKKVVLRSRGDHKTTKMLLFTTIILLLFWLPSTVLNHVPGDVLTTFRRQSAGMNALIYSCFAIRSLNHIVNFFVYLVVNKRFRGDCRQILKKLWTRN
ncbi:oxytocin receptor-like [Strongylocentrotus purpuratus]|uniref:G-protein coupled receptors family 1 profile domain-containing protein n=1 Tax=Strongylocentrotus purpuratus TaxID=7668 RepID=A0A7M7HLE5_STRPU|nr:oxytocin receptor-like [Strongylocentrotus purpuratus]|eukprot:XP_011668070.1 PREDICTED: oxytocin receptor-like [Strongylocentrotus purpuratus]